MSLYTDLKAIFEDPKPVTADAGALAIANAIGVAGGVTPPKGLLLTAITAADIANAAKFDRTGLGAGDYLGWAICNGNNGTPNLADKFIRHKSTGAGGSGGSDTHTLTVGEMPSHSHMLLEVGAMGTTGTTRYDRRADPPAWTEPTQATGGGGAHENRPAYYELVYLMKV